MPSISIFSSVSVKNTFIFILLSFVCIANGIRQGRACGTKTDIKRLMVKNDVFGCFKCDANEYWNRRKKTCVTCTGFLTNPSPNIWTSCRNKRVVEKIKATDFERTLSFENQVTIATTAEYNTTDLASSVRNSTSMESLNYNATIDTSNPTTSSATQPNMQRTRGFKLTADVEILLTKTQKKIRRARKCKRKKGKLEKRRCRKKLRRMKKNKNIT